MWLKVLGADQVIRDPTVKVLEDEDVSIETLVCSVLSTLQNLSKKLEKSKVCFFADYLFPFWKPKLSQSFSLTSWLQSKALPGSVLDETLQLIVHQKILERLLGREELLSPQQYLDMYKSTLNISIEFGKWQLPVGVKIYKNISNMKILELSKYALILVLDQIHMNADMIHTWLCQFSDGLTGQLNPRSLFSAV